MRSRRLRAAKNAKSGLQVLPTPRYRMYEAALLSLGYRNE